MVDYRGAKYVEHVEFMQKICWVSAWVIFFISAMVADPIGPSSEQVLSIRIAVYGVSASQDSNHFLFACVFWASWRNDEVPGIIVVSSSWSYLLHGCIHQKAMSELSPKLTTTARVPDISKRAVRIFLNGCCDTRIDPLFKHVLRAQGQTTCVENNTCLAIIWLFARQIVFVNHKTCICLSIEEQTLWTEHMACERWTCAAHAGLVLWVQDTCAASYAHTTVLWLTGYVLHQKGISHKSCDRWAFRLIAACVLATLQVHDWRESRAREGCPKILVCIYIYIYI